MRSGPALLGPARQNASHRGSASRHPRLGEETITLDEGGFAVVPRGVVHQPSNTSAAPAHFSSSPHWQCNVFFAVDAATDST
jgi:hypothetical protein